MKNRLTLLDVFDRRTADLNIEEVCDAMILCTYCNESCVTEIVCLVFLSENTYILDCHALYEELSKSRLTDLTFWTGHLDIGVPNVLAGPRIHRSAAPASCKRACWPPAVRV